MTRNDHVHQGMAGERHLDAIIVGASIAGLTSAATLANRGFKVAVVETLEPAGQVLGQTVWRTLPGWIVLR
jgi:2-polyprenyl-6-methoxyphenol hydroxylase-like FAD-dependent oxidoreductase